MLNFNATNIGIGQIISVDAEKSTMSVSITNSYKGNPIALPLVPFSYPGFSWDDGSGIISVPKKGDWGIFVEIKGTYYPISYIAPPIQGDPQDPYFQADKDEDLLPFPTKDGKKINFSAGRKFLSEGSRGIFGFKGSNGIIVDNQSYTRVFASPICFREYGGNTNNSEQVPFIRDFCIDYLFSSFASEKNSITLKRTGDKKAFTEEIFFQSSKKRTEPYIEITSGYHIDNVEVIRCESLKKAEEDPFGNPRSIVDDSLSLDVRGFSTNVYSSFLDSMNSQATNFVENKINEIGIPNLPNIPSQINSLLPDMPGLPEISINIPGIIGIPNMNLKQEVLKKPSSIGRQHSSIFSKTVSVDGSVCWDSESFFQFKTKKDFSIFSEGEFVSYSKGDQTVIGKKSIIVGLEESGIASKKSSIIAIDKATLYGGDEANITSLKQVNISTSSISVKIDKRVEVSSYGFGNMPSEDAGII